MYINFYIYPTNNLRVNITNNKFKILKLNLKKNYFTLIIVFIDNIIHFPYKKLRTETFELL